jgi:micrococcal nuclease
MNARQVLSTTFGLLLAISSIASAQSVENEIQAEIGRYVAAVNSGDVAAVMALYLKDPRTSTTGDGELTRSWDAVAQVYRTFFAEFDAVHLTLDSISIVPLGPSAAVAVMQLRWLLGTKKPEDLRGAMTIVYLKTAEGWRIAHDHTSVLSSPEEAGDQPLEVGSGPPVPSIKLSACVIARIVDGDTIDCKAQGRVRLIGVDTPELSQDPFGAQAAATLADVVPVGTTVGLERDVEARDRYNRVLAYVWLDSTMVNWMLVRAGWAVLLTYPPNVRYVDWFTQAQELARDEKRGLWASGGFECMPTDRRRGRCD